MNYEKANDDVRLQTALEEGHLPGETADFFTEHRLKSFWQQVVEKEAAEQRRTAGQIHMAGGYSEGGTTGLRQQDPDQDDHAPDF